MELITQWINNPRRDYSVGVQLYCMHGGDATLKRLFTAEAETKYKAEKLLKALKAIADGTETIKKAETEQATIETTTAATQATFYKGWPKESNRDETENSLWEKAVTLLKTIAHIHGTLMHLPSDADRCQAVFELLRYDEDLDDVYAAKEYYRENGCLPGKEADLEYLTDAFLIGQRISNLGRYIRREKANVAKNAANVEAVSRLQAFTKEFNYYAKKLGKEPVI